MILFAVAELSIDPGPYTIRDLLTMLDAKRRATWDAVTAIRCSIHNTSFGAKRTTRFEDLHPYRQKPVAVATKAAGSRFLDKVWGAWKTPV